MSKPRYGWWGYVRNMIRRYPDGTNTNERAAVDAAIERTMHIPNGDDRLRLIKMVFWQKNRLSLAGAAMRIPCGYETAKRWQQQFIRTVAENFRCNGLKE